MSSTFRFYERLRSLGFTTYSDYLRSDHWQTFKASYHERYQNAACESCSKKPIQLHHHDYRNLGNETHDDITPLCGVCHKTLHEILKKARKSVGWTAWAIKRLQGCLWIKQKLSKEEQEQADAAARHKELHDLRTAFGSFHARLRKEKISLPKSVLPFRRRRKSRNR